MSKPVRVELFLDFSSTFMTKPAVHMIQSHLQMESLPRVHQKRLVGCRQASWTTVCQKRRGGDEKKKLVTSWII